VYTQFVELLRGMSLNPIGVTNASSVRPPTRSVHTRKRFGTCRMARLIATSNCNRYRYRYRNRNRNRNRNRKTPQDMQAFSKSIQIPALMKANSKYNPAAERRATAQTEPYMNGRTLAPPTGAPAAAAADDDDEDHAGDDAVASAVGGGGGGGEAAAVAAAAAVEAVEAQRELGEVRAAAAEAAEAAEARQTELLALVESLKAEVVAGQGGAGARAGAEAATATATATATAPAPADAASAELGAAANTTEEGQEQEQEAEERAAGAEEEEEAPPTMVVTKHVRSGQTIYADQVSQLRDPRATRSRHEPCICQVKDGGRGADMHVHSTNHCDNPHLPRPTAPTGRAAHW
jgi:hypothetical protein